MDDTRYSCKHFVPIEQEPRHHLVIENEFVRAFAVEIAPDDRTLCHHHPHDYLLYVVGDGEIVSAARDEEPKTLSYRDGECELLEAGMVHVVENLSDTAFRNIVVELLPAAGSLRRGPTPTSGRAEPAIREDFQDHRASITVLEMGKASEVEIQGPAVLAAICAGNLAIIERGGAAKTLNQFGEAAWLAPSSRATIGNRAGRPASVALIAIGVAN